METPSSKGNRFYLPITPSKSSKTLVRADSRAGAIWATQWNLYVSPAIPRAFLHSPILLTVKSICEPGWGHSLGNDDLQTNKNWNNCNSPGVRWGALGQRTNLPSSVTKYLKGRMTCFRLSNMSSPEVLSEGLLISNFKEHCWSMDLIYVIVSLQKTWCTSLAFIWMKFKISKLPELTAAR